MRIQYCGSNQKKAIATNSEKKNNVKLIKNVFKQKKNQERNTSKVTEIIYL